MPPQKVMLDLFANFNRIWCKGCIHTTWAHTFSFDMIGLNLAGISSNKLHFYLYPRYNGSSIWSYHVQYSHGVSVSLPLSLYGFAIVLSSPVVGTLAVDSQLVRFKMKTSRWDPTMCTLCDSVFFVLVCYGSWASSIDIIFIGIYERYPMRNIDCESNSFNESLNLISNSWPLFLHHRQKRIGWNFQRIHCVFAGIGFSINSNVNTWNGMHWNVTEWNTLTIDWIKS